jgi:hypothetical protein
MTTNALIVQTPNVPTFAVVAGEALINRVDEREQALCDAPAITDQTTLTTVRSVVKAAKVLWNEIDASRQMVKAPYLDACTKIDAAAKPYLRRLEDLMDEGKRQQGQYIIDRDQKLAEDEAARRLAEIEAMKDTSRPTAPLIAPTLPEVLTAPLQSSPRVVILDPALIPQEYWVLDMAKINYDALVAKRPIPGVEVRNESIVIAR